MASAVSSLNSSYEALIAAMLKVERGPQQLLKDQRTAYTKTRSVLDTFSTTLAGLRKVAQELADPAASPFAGKTATATGTAATVTAADRAAPGAHSLTVERLARADARTSRQYDAAGTALVGFFAANGPQTFGVEVAAPTTADPARRVTLSVTVNPAGTTDGEVLGQVQAAIGAAVDAAVTAGTLPRTQAPTAAVARETSGTGRLVLRSATAGFAGRLGFTDSAGGLLAALDLTATAVSTGTAGGPLADVGTDEATSSLTAAFVLDGIRMYRNSNAVNDALDGVALKLRGVGDGSFDVAADTAGAQARVEEFVKQYNGLLDFVRQKTAVDPTTKTRGELAGDSGVTGLGFGLRGDLARTVAAAGPDADALADLGVTTGKDGTLTFADPTKLAAALERDGAAVQTLFGGTDGVATRLVGRLDAFLGADGKAGLVAGRKDGLDAQVKRLDTRIKDWDTRLAAREESLRLQFARLQEVVESMQNQQNYLGSLLYGSY